MWCAFCKKITHHFAGDVVQINNTDLPYLVVAIYKRKNQANQVLLVPENDLRASSLFVEQLNRIQRVLRTSSEALKESVKELLTGNLYYVLLMFKGWIEHQSQHNHPQESNFSTYALRSKENQDIQQLQRQIKQLQRDSEERKRQSSSHQKKKCKKQHTSTELNTLNSTYNPLPSQIPLLPSSQLISPFAALQSLQTPYPINPNALQAMCGLNSPIPASVLSQIASQLPQIPSLQQPQQLQMIPAWQNQESYQNKQIVQQILALLAQLRY